MRSDAAAARALPLDAAILFSDILTIPDAMGLGLHFVDGEGRSFERPVRNEADVARLARAGSGRELRYVMDAVRLIRRELARPRAADRFFRQPVDARLLHGRRRGLATTSRASRRCCTSEPDLMHALLDIDRATRSPPYLNAQIDAGAQAVMMFDTWGGVLAPAAVPRSSRCAYSARSSPSLKREQDGDACRSFCSPRAAAPWLEAMARDAAAMRWASTGRLISARRARASATASRCRAISIRPCCSRRRRRSAPKSRACSASFGRGHGHVFNLGHGIHPAIDPEHAGAMIAAVHELSPPYHAV